MHDRSIKELFTGDISVYPFGLMGIVTSYGHGFRFPIYQTISIKRRIQDTANRSIDRCYFKIQITPLFSTAKIQYRDIWCVYGIYYTMDRIPTKGQSMRFDRHNRCGRLWEDGVLELKLSSKTKIRQWCDNNEGRRNGLPSVIDLLFHRQVAHATVRYFKTIFQLECIDILGFYLSDILRRALSIT